MLVTIPACFTSYIMYSMHFNNICQVFNVSNNCYIQLQITQTCVIPFPVKLYRYSIYQKEIVVFFEVKLFNEEKDTQLFKVSIFNSHYNFTVCVVPIGRVARILNAPSLSPIFLWAGVWRRDRELMRTLTTVGRHMRSTTENTARWVLGSWLCGHK